MSKKNIFTKPLNEFFFYGFMISALYQITLKNVGPFPKLSIVEFGSVIISIYYFLNFLMYKKIQKFDFRDNHNLALMSLCFVAVVNWVRYPVFSEHMMRGVDAGSGGIRAYFSIFIGVLLFGVAKRTVSKKEIDYEKVFRIILYFSIFWGSANLYNHFFALNIPFLAHFGYRPESGFGSALRIAGLDNPVIFGTASIIVLSKYYTLKRSLLYISLFTFFVIISGGRTLGVSYSLLWFFYLVLLEKKVKNSLKYLVLISLTILFIIVLTPKSILFAQFNRLSKIQGGVKEQYYERRWQIYQLQVDNFKRNPLFGKGIGYRNNIRGMDENSLFIRQQLQMGGHGAYYSIIGIFGLFGAFFLLIFIYYTMYKCYTMIKLNPEKKENSFYLFILLVLFNLAIGYYAGSSGYREYKLYFLVGCFVGFYKKMRIEGKWLSK